MSKHVICHAHCPRDGGGGTLVLVVLAVVVLASIARPVVNAAIDVLEVALIAAASFLALAAIGGIAYVALRVRSRPTRELQGVSRHVLVARRVPGTLSGSRQRAIEAPQPALADIEALAAENGYDLTRQEG